MSDHIKGENGMNASLIANARVLFAAQISIAIALCLCFSVDAVGTHVRGHIDVVNLLVNKEKKAVLPEGLFDVVLNDGCAYEVAYKVKEPIAPEEQLKLEEIIPASPKFRYVDRGEHFAGIMPADIRRLFDDIDKFCATNGTDYFAASIDSKILNNGEFSRGVFFVITNTPPSKESAGLMHPVFEKLSIPTLIKPSTISTNSIPDGANPASWFRSE